MSTAFYNPFLRSTHIVNPQINSKRDYRKYELRTLISIESTLNVWYDQTNLSGFRWLISCRAIISSILHCFHLFFFYSSKPTNDRNCDEHTIETWCLLPARGPDLNCIHCYGFDQKKAALNENTHKSLCVIRIYYIENIVYLYSVSLTTMQYTIQFIILYFLSLAQT